MTLMGVSSSILLDAAKNILTKAQYEDITTTRF